MLDWAWTCQRFFWQFCNRWSTLEAHWNPDGQALRPLTIETSRILKKCQNEARNYAPKCLVQDNDLRHCFCADPSVVLRGAYRWRFRIQVRAPDPDIQGPKFQHHNVPKRSMFCRCGKEKCMIAKRKWGDLFPANVIVTQFGADPVLTRNWKQQLKFAPPNAILSCKCKVSFYEKGILSPPVGVDLWVLLKWTGVVAINIPGWKSSLYDWQLCFSEHCIMHYSPT